MRLRYHLLGMALLLSCYAAVVVPHAAYMRDKPYVEKLGLVPRAEVLQAFSADQKEFTAAAVVTKVVLYFGGLMAKGEGLFALPPDYQGMSRTLHAALKLDPYNMDGYYFAQSILVWDVKQYKIATSLLEYGMKYRSWDWQLPFFAAFDYAYFLKDYPKAAQMYMRAGELSGNDMFQTLAGRYLQQAGETELAIDYLTVMEKGATDPAVRESFRVRLKAFRAVRVIELARDRYRGERGSQPRRIDELVAAGYLKRSPVDPYGGVFYLEPDGKVATTSKFSFAGAAKSKKKEK